MSITLDFFCVIERMLANVFICFYHLGEYGFYMKDPANKDDKNKPRIDFSASQDEIDMVDEDELYQQEKVYVESLTPLIVPLTHEKKYLHVPFGSEKPCCHIKFPFEDQRRRHYNNILLLKIWTILVRIIDMPNTLQY